MHHPVRYSEFVIFGIRKISPACVTVIIDYKNNKIMINEYRIRVVLSEN